MIDILFVHANASRKIYQGLANQHSAIEPPIWAAMLANSVRQIGYQPAILDAEAERIDFFQAVERIKDFKARIICFVVYGQQPSASTQNMEGACGTARLLKGHVQGVFVVFVGAYVSALPTKTLRDEPAIDAICQNEGVYTLRDLLAVDNLRDTQLLSKVRGLGFRDGDGNITLNSTAAIVPMERLEVDLPGMAWDLLPPLSQYRTAGWHSWSNNSIKEPFAALYTSLGCPYRCSFCMINIINRIRQGDEISSADSNIYRRWNPEFVIRQFDHFAMNGVRNIKIADELFVLNPNHFIRICELIRERGYDFNIWAYSRVDTCKPRYLDILRAAGVFWLGLGIENPSVVMRREIHKDGYLDVKIVDIIRMIQESGIHVGGNYIFGLPNDTLESMQATLDFSLENLTEMANFYCAMAYPGSPLYNQACAQGIELPKTYSGYSQHAYDTLNMRNDKLSASEILRFRDSAWQKYHTSPRYLAWMESRFGADARADLERTTKIELKRHLLGD
ncbi:anaerobic magnesium-protoporphyrin IX monomethyl ester cyclase [Gammaproteobacteria bacterium]